MKTSNSPKIVRNLLLVILLAGLCWATAAPAAHPNSKLIPPPEVFDGQGTIDFISSTTMSIDDSLFHYGAGTRFYSEEGRLIGSGYFAAGMAVRFILRKNAEKQIVKIWKIKSDR